MTEDHQVPEGRQDDVGDAHVPDLTEWVVVLRHRAVWEPLPPALESSVMRELLGKEPDESEAAPAPGRSRRPPSAPSD
ncbi:hypothetical protein ACFY3U_27205 [Micromonospora sp. NPDC000089]|uniref:hypothetical protein n=1 Tax=unclassified Micromonospora TaxID=2617518 RepID=UPI0036A5C839